MAPPAATSSTRLAAALATALGLVACGDGGGGDAPDARPPIDAAPAVDAPPPDADDRLLPDLSVDQARARADLALRQRTFADDACELDPDEACIGGPGPRRLLHFSVETPNLGTADMVLGTPQPDNEQFDFSACHGHYHFEGYAEYRLLAADGGEVAAGRKQAFCLLDSSRYLDEDDVARRATYDCEFQGIQRGWSDVYHSKLPCQFIDVTDVPDGSYTLEVRINQGGTLPELSLDNNAIEVPVELGAADLAGPTEACPSDLGPRAASGLNRECGWTLEEVVECTAGQSIHVGCATGCDLGSSTGDPILRVCDAERPDGNCAYPTALADDDDACNGQGPVASFVECPDSGRLAVYSAPFRDGEAYSCTLASRPAAGGG